MSGKVTKEMVAEQTKVVGVLLQVANMADGSASMQMPEALPGDATQEQRDARFSELASLGRDAADFMANYTRNSLSIGDGSQGLNKSLIAGRAQQAELAAAAQKDAVEQYGVYNSPVPVVEQQTLEGIAIPQDVHALQRTVSALREEADKQQERLDKYDAVRNAMSEPYTGMPSSAMGVLDSSPSRKQGQYLRSMAQRMGTAHQLRSFAALYLGDLAVYLKRQDAPNVYKGYADTGNQRVSKLADNVQGDLTDTRPWFVWAEDNITRWKNEELQGFGFYSAGSDDHVSLFLDPVAGKWLYEDNVAALKMTPGSAAAEEALQRIYASALVGSNDDSNAALEAWVQMNQDSGSSDYSANVKALQDNVAEVALKEAGRVKNVSVNSLVRNELKSCVKDLEWKQQHTSAGLTDDEGRALRVYKEALGLQNPSDAESFLSQVKESLAYKDFTHKMSTLGLISRVNTLYNIVYTLQDFWKQIMYTDMSDSKRLKWRNWVRRRLDMVQQYIEDRDNIMGKSGELLKSARKKLEKQADGLMLERTWASIYITVKYLDLALREKEAPLYFEARPLSQDEAMTRLKADGGWGKASLRTQRPDDNEAMKLCQAEGLKVRYFDSHWSEDMPGTPMLDPHDPSDARKIEAYLKNQSGRLVVDCDGLIVSHTRGGQKEHLRLAMPKAIPVSALGAIMPFVSYNKKSGRIEHHHPSIRQQLQHSIREAEKKQDKRLRTWYKGKSAGNLDRVDLVMGPGDRL
jgi:hypothetical protein